MVAKKKKKKSNFFKYVLVIGLVLLALALYKLFALYQDIEEPNVKLDGKKSTYIYIPTGANYKQVTNILYDNNFIINRASFEWVAEKKGYADKVKPGRYELKEGMSNNALVNLLRSGKQSPVKLVFNKIRTKALFAGIISRQIEADSTKILELLNNKKFLSEFGLKPETAICLFIPNTYEFYWNTDAKAFVRRMHTEYEKFWTKNRREKARNLELSQEQVITMASIVEEETTKKDEKAKVAGVYYNRIHKGMRLQADPTVRFAVGNFEIKRILNKHLQIDSPYNTYQHSGLPPGPICIPTISSIDAVLNLEKHKYLYFCAKADFSGYHAFAKTLQEHNQNAAKYRKALNKNRIYR
jgi:UPF0755 protein